MRRSVGILAFDDMEVLDFAGPYEVFNVAAELDPSSGLTVSALGLGPGNVVGRGGFTVVPRGVLGEAVPDLLIVPGGAGTRPLLRRPEVIDQVRRAADGTGMVASVCTGALVLAAAGLLEGRPATTHHDAYDELAVLSPTTEIRRGERYVRSSERIWTSAGVSAGVDLALHLVELLLGAATKEAVVAEMEWGW
jgi:transcriptional regulator GlxA family with amidase domain